MVELGECQDSRTGPAGVEGYARGLMRQLSVKRKEEEERVKKVCINVEVTVRLQKSLDLLFGEE